MRHKLYRLLVAVVAITALTSSAVAFAAWSVSSGTGSGGSGAGSMPAGSTPTASVTNRNVSVTWPLVTVPGHGPANSYRVTRFNTSGVAQTTTNNCTGQVSGLTCTEIGVPPGQWRYRVAPRYGSWDGANGPQSAAVTVNAPTVSLNPTTITQFPALVTATISNYLPNQSVSIRMDSATGTVLGSLTSSAGGGGSTNVSIPNTVADGAHSLHAVGAGGDTSNAPFTINAPLLTPTALALINGGGSISGQIQQNDIVQVTFSQPLLVSSVCAGAPDNNQPVTAPGFVRITNNNGTSGHDLLTVDTTLCPGGLSFGSISLGSSGFVSSTQQFDATITYTPANRRVTVVLGSRTTGGTAPARVNQSVTAIYTPDPAMMAPNGRPITGTVSSTGVQF